MTGPQRLAAGKVRDLYAGPDGLLLFVASDRISAFDHVLPTPIPDKGRVLTALSVWWFERLADLVPHHLVSADDPAIPDRWRGRAMLARRLEMVPVECVARGYLAGSGVPAYRETGAVSGVELPPGLQDGSRLPAPIFTPTTKAPVGAHDEAMTYPEVVAAVGPDRAARLRDLTLAVYERGAGIAAGRGILLADTKLEFGRDGDQVVLADEVLTPDSSRFWPAGGWSPGHSPPSFDKQYVRDWLETHDWDHQPPAPALPPDVVAGTAARYREAYERLAGRPLDAWLAEARG